MKALHDIPEVKSGTSTLRLIGRDFATGHDWFEVYYRDLLNQPVQRYQQEFARYADLQTGRFDVPRLDDQEREIRRLRREIDMLRMQRNRDYEAVLDYYRNLRFPDETERE